MTRSSSRNRERDIVHCSALATRMLSGRCIQRRAGNSPSGIIFRQAFEHNRGIRIDHFLLSPKLAGRLKSCEIDREPRAQEKPSDHAPIIVELL